MLVKNQETTQRRLTQDRSLQVILPRQLQDKKISSLSDAGRQFGANLGFKVALEPSSELVRVSYSLLDVKTGKALAGDSIIVPAADVFAVQDDVTQGAVTALHLQLRPEERRVGKECRSRWSPYL